MQLVEYIRQAADAAEVPMWNFVALSFAAATAVLYLLHWGLRGKRSNVYLMDLSCFAIPERLRYGRQEIMDRCRERNKELNRNFPESSFVFMEKVLEVSGLGDATGLSDAIVKLISPGNSDKTSIKDSLAETEMIIFDVVADVLKKTGVKPQEVDAVITTCSCFAPTPSMAAMLVNKFKMRRDVLTYAMAGMGCSSSLVAVDLAKHLLKALPNRRILVVNHENITNCWYAGNDKSMLIVNALFRLGGAAVLLSNRPQDAWRAKYKLLHTVRTHLGADDDAFGCMGNGEDADGVQGVFLRRNVIPVAGRSLKENLTVLGPKVLPIWELLRCALDRSYIPSFARAFDHFLLHTGGRGVLDDIEAKLGLVGQQAQPSKDALWRFGNTSAASTWYILSNIEHFGTMKRGDRVWQLGFGGGFKCNSAVWQACRRVKSQHKCWED